MKKHLLKALTLISLTTILLSGCGNAHPVTDDSTTTVTDTSVPVSTPTAKPTEAPVSTPAPTEKATPSPTPVPTPTPEPTPEVTEPALPEDRAWIDDIYNMFVSNDSAGLLNILTDPDLSKKAMPYEYKGWSYLENQTAYQLFTTDGKIIGLILYDENGYFSNSIFYCEDAERAYGFDTIETGDKIMNCYKSTQNGKIMYDWYDGVLEYYSDGQIVDPVTYGGYFLVWQM